MKIAIVAFWNEIVDLYLNALHSCIKVRHATALHVFPSFHKQDTKRLFNTQSLVLERVPELHLKDYNNIWER